jgi:hypothetical protein
MKINKLPVPIEVNGQIARFKLTHEIFITDVATATDVLHQSNVTWLFGMTKAEARRRFADQRAERIERRDRLTADVNEEVANLDGVIADIDAS